MARPPREARRRVRWSPTADVARPPRVVCRGGDCEIACVWSGSGDFTLSDGVWCCSGTTAVGPTWWWPSLVRCGLFILFLCRREAVPDGGYMRWRRLSAAALVEWSRSCRRPNPTGQCCLLETFAWLASMFQFGQLELLRIVSMS